MKFINHIVKVTAFILAFSILIDMTRRIPELNAYETISTIEMTPIDTVIIHDTLKIADFSILFYFKQARDSAVQFAIREVEFLTSTLKDRITDSFLDSCMNVLSFIEKIQFFLKPKDTVTEKRIKLLFERNVLHGNEIDSIIREIVIGALDKYSDILIKSRLFRSFTNDSQKVKSKNLNTVVIDSIVTVNGGNLPPVKIPFPVFSLIKTTLFKKKEPWYRRFLINFTKKFMRSKGVRGIRIIKGQKGGKIRIIVELIYEILTVIKDSKRREKMTKLLLKLQLYNAIDNFKNKILYDHDAGILHIIDEYENDLINKIVKLQSGGINP